jgi:murein L,D-transpeptidase YafK
LYHCDALLRYEPEMAIILTLMSSITLRGFYCLLAMIGIAALPAAASAQDFSSTTGMSVASGGTLPDSEALPGRITADGGTAAAAMALSFSSISAGNAASGAAPNAGLERADKVLINKSERRLYLVNAGRVIADYPIRLGLNPYGHKQREGDFRTPEGNYHLVRRNPNSRFFLSIEVSYPNEEDRQRAREAGARPGGLIMIHGQPNAPTRSRGYYASRDWTDGCIALSNGDMAQIWQRTTIGTPIEIVP